MTNHLDRMVHARAALPLLEVVRYDRQGRWYLEGPGTRQRLRTVHEAVEQAVLLEGKGGEIFTGRPGGNRFDYMVEAARRKVGS